MEDDQLYKEINDAVLSIPIFDNHEHLMSEEEKFIKFS